MRKDRHHLLYQRKHWNQGYAAKLRNHRYFWCYIPANTLHQHIHDKLHDIPVPSGADCRRAYEELLLRIEVGSIDVWHDKAERKLGFLIEMWRENNPATVALLEWQRQMFQEYYH